MDLNILYPKYTELRKASPEFARKFVINVYTRLKNISVVARHFRTESKDCKENSSKI